MSRDKMIKNEVVATIISVVVIVVVLLGFTYGLFGKSMGFFSDTQEGSTNVIQFGDIGMTFCDNSNCASGLNNNISINGNSSPTTIETALSQTPYSFVVENTGTLPLTIKIFLESTIGPSEAKTYELWTWLKEDAPNTVQGTQLTTSIRVQGEYLPYSSLPDLNQVKVTFATNYGILPVSSKTVIVGEKYGDLPILTSEGYTFKGWNGKNLLNYNNLSDAAKSVGISVDENGYISDSTNTSDGRIWDYDNSNWKVNLKAGSYTLSLLFSNQISSASTSGINIYNNDGFKIYGYTDHCWLCSVDNHIVNFTLNEDSNIGIFIKAYDGIYRIQLEKGNEATEWEPFYIQPSTEVTQFRNHTLTAIWEQD